MESRCYWDGHAFQGEAVRIPIEQKTDGTFLLDTITFCSFPCAMGHITKCRQDPMVLVYLQMYMKSLGVAFENMRSAHDPRVLRVYRSDGNGVDIVEFRNGTATPFVETSMNDSTSPMIAVEDKQFNFVSLNIKEHGLSPLEYYEEEVVGEVAGGVEKDEEASINMSD